ncbi:hypothetical protein IF1G_11177 [Cordyceps javanica]|uniref:Uncharacterized protein n=1 Tax=Cordyceps javanica TaxID=43265 RepID=A0A545UL36_9HYPO|nr:hypothetical protein IF1G_11177 [Cordyceps javanica]
MGGVTTIAPCPSSFVCQVLSVKFCLSSSVCQVLSVKFCLPSSACQVPPSKSFLQIPSVKFCLSSLVCRVPSVKFYRLVSRDGRTAFALVSGGECRYYCVRVVGFRSPTLADVACQA